MLCIIDIHEHDVNIHPVIIHTVYIYIHLYNCNYASLWYYNVCVDFHKDIQHIQCKSCGGNPMLNGSSDRNRAQLWGSEGWFGLKDSSHGIWAFFNFPINLQRRWSCLGAITADWFSWGIYQPVRLESMTKFGSTRMTPCIDEAIGCNWTLETPKGESIETYRTFWTYSSLQADCKAALPANRSGRNMERGCGDVCFLVVILSSNDSLLVQLVVF